MIVVNMKCHLCRCALKNSCFLRHKLWHGALSLRLLEGVRSFLHQASSSWHRFVFSHLDADSHLFRHCKRKSRTSIDRNIENLRDQNFPLHQQQHKYRFWAALELTVPFYLRLIKALSLLNVEKIQQFFSTILSAVSIQCRLQNLSLPKQ